MTGAGARAGTGLGLLLAGWLLTGCGTTGKRVEHYPGPSRPTNEVSVLKIQNPGMFGRSAYLWSVDGEIFNKRHRWSNTEELVLLPGPHFLEFLYNGADPRHPSPVKVLFDFQSNRVYQLRMMPVKEGFFKSIGKQTVGGTFYVTTWITDERTGEVVYGNPREDKVRWYEP